MYVVVCILFHSITVPQLIILIFLSSSDLIEKGNAASSILWSDSWMAMKAVMRVQTFRIIVLQGIVGSLPWTAMVFFTMWFELIGKDRFT